MSRLPTATNPPKRLVTFFVDRIAISSFIAVGGPKFEALAKHPAQIYPESFKL
jgi:hypothetical protein